MYACAARVGTGPGTTDKEEASHVQQHAHHATCYTSRGNKPGEQCNDTWLCLWSQHRLHGNFQLCQSSKKITHIHKDVSEDLCPAMGRKQAQGS